MFTSIKLKLAYYWLIYKYNDLRCLYSYEYDELLKLLPIMWLVWKKGDMEYYTQLSLKATKLLTAIRCKYREYKHNCSSYYR